jgi:uncharacterized protein
MKRCLVDVNVILALLVRQHVHHALARGWFAELQARQAGLCRLVQLGLVRLLGNRTIMANDAVPALVGWRIIEELLQDERLEFLPEPSRIDTLLPAVLDHPVSPGKLVSDAYLAAFAMTAALQLVTLDRDFLRFRRLDVRLLA